MKEQELYDEIEVLKEELENGQISPEEAASKLDELLKQVEELIEEKLTDLDRGMDMGGLFDDN